MRASNTTAELFFHLSKRALTLSFYLYFRDISLPNICTRQEFFTDATAARLRREWTDEVLQQVESSEPCSVKNCSSDPPQLLFASDIRTADWRVMTDGGSYCEIGILSNACHQDHCDHVFLTILPYSTAQVEKVVAADMDAQQRWVQILRPTAALLKFRLPWDAGVTQYLAGAVVLPVWGPPTTTESRLLVLSPALVDSVIRYRRDKDFRGAAPPPPTMHVSNVNSCVASRIFLDDIVRDAVNCEIASMRYQLHAEHISIVSGSHSPKKTSAALCDHYPLEAWNNTNYSEQLFYFNTDTRVRAYYHNCSDIIHGSKLTLGVDPSVINDISNPHRSFPFSSIATEKRKRGAQKSDVCVPLGEKFGPSLLCLSEGSPSAPDVIEPEIVGLDHCFDCSAEMCILRSLVAQIQQKNSDDAGISDVLRQLSASISAAISPQTGRTLTTVVSQTALRFPCHVRAY